MGTQWTIRKMARWVWGWRLVLPILRGIWIGVMLVVAVATVLTGDLLEVPLDTDERWSWASSWIMLLGVLAILAGPAACLGLGRKHITWEPLRGAIWIARAFHLAMLISVGSSLIWAILQYDQLGETWDAFRLIGHAMAIAVTLVLWNIGIALTNPLERV